MAKKLWVMTILFACFIMKLAAADSANAPTNAVPDLKARLGAADKQVKAKEYDAAEAALLAIGKERDLDAPVKAHVTRSLLGLYAAKGDVSNQTLYAKQLLALPEADAKLKTEALQGLERLTGFTPQYDAYYDKLRPAEEVRQMEKDHRLYCEELARLNPSNATFRIGLGNVYMRDGAAEKGATEFAAALALPNLSAMQQGDALVGLAGTALLKGDRAAAIRHCEDLVARNLNTSGRNSRDPVAQAKAALQFMKGPQLDGLELPFYTGAKAFPTPQQAVYKEEFVPLTSVKLVLGSGIKADDVRLALLKTKLTRFGVKFEDNAPFAIGIGGEGEPKAPEKPEGYALTVTKDGAVIHGHDAQGTLWGIVSLIQLVDLEQGPKIRIADLLDWPVTARRGFMQLNWKDALEYTLFCKMNTAVSQGGPQLVTKDPSQPWTPLQKEICRGQCEEFAAFGLQMYYGIVAYTMWWRLPLSSERTFDLHYAVCSEIAKARGHVYFPYDDNRFPLPQADLDKFGSAANMDAKYLTRLFQAVRKDQPGFHMVFCPPFYWGPDSPAAYPEPREPYLKSLGEFLDPAIEVYWTGPRVKGYEKTKEQVDWFAGLIKRKPAVCQNGAGPHNLQTYITDETPGWKTWHYDGFFENDIEWYVKNTGLGSDAAQTATLADCLWNVKAYDPALSIRRGVAMLYGKEMFEILDPGNKAMAYLDKYRDWKVTPEAVTEISESEKRVAAAEAAWNKALAYNGSSMANFPGHLGGAIQYSKRLIGAAKKAPDFYKKYAQDIDDTRALAVQEVQLDAAKGDIFKSPVDFMGGRMINYANKCPKRFGTAIRGKRTATPIARTGFECDPFPPSGDYFLHLSAQDDDAEAPCKIRIAVNGKPIFEGPSPFVRYGWSQSKITIPFDSMKRNNSLTIETSEDSANENGPPWFLINYAVIRKATP